MLANLKRTMGPTIFTNTNRPGPPGSTYIAGMAATIGHAADRGLAHHGLIQSLREQSINVTTHRPETDKRARVITQTDLPAAQFDFHGRPHGSKTSLLNCWLSPGATTTRSTR
jgi:hypothetical protein